MATNGHNKAIAQKGCFRLCGYVARVAWMVVHIFFLIGFRNRLAVIAQWGWSYWTYSKHARLIGARDCKHPSANR